MDLNIKTVIGSARSVSSLNEDINITLDLNGFDVTQNENNKQNQVSVTDLANIERQTLRNYKIYGTIDYVSQLDGITKNYNTLDDFFNIYVEDKKKFIDDFNVLLLKPHNEFTLIDENTYIRKYEVLTSSDSIDILKSGFSKNLFGTQNLNFLFSDTFSLLDTFDGLEYPITNLVLYFQYRPKNSETLSGTTYDNLNNEIMGEIFEIPQKGDIINGEIFNHNPKSYLQTDFNNIKHIIETPYNSNSLKWEYNPFVKIKIFEYSSTVNTINSKTTDISKLESIPFNSVKVNDTHYWRNILDIGYIDPILNVGLDYPFINGIHYVFNNIVFFVKPYLLDANTSNVFKEVVLETNKIKRYQPDTLNRIGSVC